MARALARTKAVGFKNCDMILGDIQEDILLVLVLKLLKVKTKRVNKSALHLHASFYLLFAWLLKVDFSGLILKGHVQS